MTVQALKARWNELSPSRRRIIRGLIGVTIGAAAGYTYYAVVGCSTGSCPITSDPLISTGWGALIGGFWALG